MQNGRPRQMLGMMIAHSELPPSSHTGRSPSSPVQSTRNLLITPTSLCHMNCHSTATTKLGTIHGVSISVRATFWSRIGRFSSSATASPPPSVPATVQNV